MLKDTFSFRRQENEALLIVDEDDHFAVVLVEILVGEDVFAWKTQEEPVEQVCGFIWVESILSCDQ